MITEQLKTLGGLFEQVVIEVHCLQAALSIIFSLRKRPQFHLISQCGNFAERHSFCIVSETVLFRKISAPGNQVKLRSFSQCLIQKYEKNQSSSCLSFQMYSRYLKQITYEKKIFNNFKNMFGNYMDSDYKMQQKGLQSLRGWCITKCVKRNLQSAISVRLQMVYYKMCQKKFTKCHQCSVAKTNISPANIYLFKVKTDTLEKDVKYVQS